MSIINLIIDNYVVTKLLDKCDSKNINRIDIHHNGKNIAFLTYHPSNNGNYQWIDSLYVDPKYRGKGLGHMLMNHVINDNYDKEFRLRVKPFKDNFLNIEDLKNFYKKYDFVEFDNENRMIRKIFDK